MIKTTFKPLLLLGFMISSLFLTAQTAPDEDTRPFSVCTPEGANEARVTDIPNAVNVGTIDDRSCYANYKESIVDGITWGNYDITNGSNNQDTNGLQPRIERSFPRSRATGVGSYARFTGTVRILEVGFTGRAINDGSYIMQAKGTHTGGGGSRDPAICLYLAKPVFEVDANGNRVQTSFNLYREQINFRGGSGAQGRTEVLLTNIKKNVPTDIVLEVGFRQDPNDATKRIHYSDAIIGGEVFNWNIPEPEKGRESGIRYGAYRVKGGRAQMRWANTTYRKTEVAFNPNANKDFVRLRNVATGKFLTDSGTSSQPVLMGDSGEADNTHWTFVDSGTFVNLDSKTSGILRATGSGFSGGAFSVVTTGKAAPAEDGDKVWTIHHDEANNTYRFEAANSGRYLYHGADGIVTNIESLDTDDRSVWQAISTSETLSISNTAVNSSSVKVYPNPAEDQFTIALNGLKNVTVQIYDMLGKIVYKKTAESDNIHINASNQFKPGIHLVRVTSVKGNVIHKKLIIK